METRQHRDFGRTLLVWGYIRRVGKQYRSLSIPLEINDIIYLYQRLYDQWNQEIKHRDRHVSVDTDKSIITINTNYQWTIYGTKIVKEGEFSWKVKIISFNRNETSHYPYIGIVVEKDKEDFQDDDDFAAIGYQLCGGSGRLYAFSDVQEEKELERDIWVNDGDILEMSLNLDEQTLSYKINDTDFGALFTGVKPDQYRLALGVGRCKDSQFQLLV